MYMFLYTGSTSLKACTTQEYENTRTRTRTLLRNAHVVLPHFEDDIFGTKQKVQPRLKLDPNKLTKLFVTPR